MEQHGVGPEEPGQLDGFACRHLCARRGIGHGREHGPNRFPGRHDDLLSAARARQSLADASGLFDPRTDAGARRVGISANRAGARRVC
jgi:hypothetical protein